MSFIGRLLGSDKALSGVVDGVTKGFDALVYTDEEKAGDAAKDRSEARRMVVDWMKNTQGQNLARRLLALSISGVWLSMWVASALVSMAAVFVNDSGTMTALKLGAVSDIAQANAGEMNAPVMLILAFYFAAPHMGDVAKAVTTRMTKGVRQ